MRTAWLDKTTNHWSPDDGEYFIALYGWPPDTSHAVGLFPTLCQYEKSPKVMVLPPTSSNLLQHVIWAHFQNDHALESSRSSFTSRRIDQYNLSWVEVQVGHIYTVTSELFDIAIIIEVCGNHKDSISCIVIVPAKMDVAIHSRSDKNLRWDNHEDRPISECRTRGSIN